MGKGKVQADQGQDWNLEARKGAETKVTESGCIQPEPKPEPGRRCTGMERASVGRGRFVQCILSVRI